MLCYLYDCEYADGTPIDEEEIIASVHDWLLPNRTTFDDETIIFKTGDAVTSEKIETLPNPLVISVGRLIKEKNHECLIKSMKNVNAHCIIIGNGDRYKELENLRVKWKSEGKKWPNIVHNMQHRIGINAGNIVVLIGNEIMGKLGKKGEVLDLINISTDYFSN